MLFALLVPVMTVFPVFLSFTTKLNSLSFSVRPPAFRFFVAFGVILAPTGIPVKVIVPTVSPFFTVRLAPAFQAFFQTLEAPVIVIFSGFFNALPSLSRHSIWKVNVVSASTGAVTFLVSVKLVVFVLSNTISDTLELPFLIVFFVISRFPVALFLFTSTVTL